MRTEEKSKDFDADSSNLNISQLAGEAKKLEALFRQWKKVVYSETGTTLLIRITEFVNECRYILNRGVVPTNPKKKLAKRTVQMVENYMSKWSRISLDVKKNTSSTVRLLSYRYARATYDEPSDNEFATSIEALSVSSDQTEERIKLGKRGVSRDFYGENHSS